MAFRHGAESIRRATAACGLAIIAIAFGSLAISQDRPLYQLGAGDVVEVIVAGEPDLSAPGPGGVTVGPDGRIGLPHAGMINVEGLTCEEAASRIADALTPDILVDPEVLVRVIEFRSRAIFVIGEVKTPGVFPHAPGLTVRRAVALAGGVAIDPSGPPSRISGRIVRSDGSLVDVALGDALRGDDDAGDLPMEPGDTLVVLVETDLAATVLGAVASPGTYVPPRGARLTDLVAMAGGPTGTADINNVTVQRSRDETITCDLAAAMAGDGDNNPAIEPGDLIYVPTITRAASIIGNVQDPGKYEFAEGDRVSSLLAQAKGVMRGDEAGDLSNITVVRADGTIVDVDLAQANAAADPLLQPGDLVIVPETDLFITVTGHVVNAGRYRFNVGDTARTAI
ncbi:MAG TPA: SLBB domain-containing protein, partial [Armatimonadota bacterium]|nr:SLBB domain-containing protein [Armatimonadota bacterium]